MNSYPEENPQSKGILSYLLWIFIASLICAALGVWIFFTLYEESPFLGKMWIGVVLTFFVWGVYELFIKHPKK